MVTPDFKERLWGGCVVLGRCCMWSVQHLQGCHRGDGGCSWSKLMPHGLPVSWKAACSTWGVVGVEITCAETQKQLVSDLVQTRERQTRKGWELANAIHTHTSRLHLSSGSASLIQKNQPLHRNFTHANEDFDGPCKITSSLVWTVPTIWEPSFPRWAKLTAQLLLWTQPQEPQRQQFSTFQAWRPLPALLPNEWALWLFQRRVSQTALRTRKQKGTHNISRFLIL